MKSVTPHFLPFGKSRSLPFCVASFKKIYTLELLGTSVLKSNYNQPAIYTYKLALSFPELSRVYILSILHLNHFSNPFNIFGRKNCFSQFLFPLRQFNTFSSSHKLSILRTFLKFSLRWSPVSLRESNVYYCWIYN